MLIGADPDRLDALASQMDTDAFLLEQMRGRVGGVLEQLLWQGTDSHGFFEQWTQHFVGMIGSAVAGLREAADCLRAEASQQRSASAAGEGFELLGPIGGFLLTGGELGLDGVKILDKAPWAGGLLKDLHAGEAVKSVSAFAEAVGPGLAALGLEADFTNFLVNRSQDPNSAATLKSGIDTGLAAVDFAAETTAVIGGPEVAEALLLGVPGVDVVAGVAVGLELGNDLVSKFDPEFDEQLLHGGEAGAKIVASGVDGALSFVGRTSLAWARAF